MARVFAYDRIEYRDRQRQTQIIERGAVAELDDKLADQLATDHAESVVLLRDGEEPPRIGNDYATTVKLAPDMDRQMLPRRMSPQKRRQLKAAQRRSRRATMTVISEG